MKIEDVEKLTSPTYCILPWIHLSTRPSGELRSCCTANASSVSATNDKAHGGKVGTLKTEDGKPQNLNKSTFTEAWNSTYMRNVRLKMLNGEKPASCMKCYNEEDSGHRSKRQWETEYWTNGGRTDINQVLAETDYATGTLPPKLYYVDLRMGNKCQLGCVICSPVDSSGWIKDWMKLHPIIENPKLKENMSQWENKGLENGASYNWHKNNPKFWDEMYQQIPHMKQLYFAGGEATVIEEHYTLLEKVIEMGYAHQIEVRYNTNGIELPDRLLKIWDKFKEVRVHYSVDSIFGMNDYIRHGSNWDHTLKQMHRLDKDTGDNVIVTIACTISALSVFYIPDFIKWKLAQGFKKINAWPFGGGLINSHFLAHPPQLAVRSLTKSQKTEVENKFTELYQWLDDNWELSGAPTKEDFMNDQYSIKRLKGIIRFMNDADWSVRQEEFREYISKLDSIRNTNFRETFPEIAHWMGNA